ncbi:alpha/beta hydrolase [Streptomyces sp. SID13031]|uniref:alpha/beta fold hydrolase n=1 Tax=Streptomyces sp. SID13031 TaxID=2706046 RepID=UPI0013CBAF7F|nr:alpha/beta hydrolase [Streptomyces sp. SID13031]
MKRFLRRVLIVVVVFLVVITAGSFGYNAFTSGTASAPDGLKFVQAGDVRTRYETWGTTGTPVVLVHGSVESVDTWSRLVPLLAAKHRVYAYDITGYGYSERKAPYTVEHLAAQLLGFLDAMHLGGPGQPRPILVGHSLGAGIAAEATLEAPARVGGLMFLDGDGLPLPGGGPPTALIVPPYRTTLFRMVLGSDWLLRRIYKATCGPSCPAMDVDQWVRPFRQPGAEKAVWEMTAHGIPAVPADRLARLRDVPVATAVVFGALDTQGGNADETATRIGAPAPTIIPGANHLTPISNPGEIATAVDALAARS